MILHRETQYDLFHFFHFLTQHLATVQHSGPLLVAAQVPASLPHRRRPWIKHLPSNRNGSQPEPARLGQVLASPVVLVALSVLKLL